MNYTWDYLIKALHRGYEPIQIDFIPATYFSPYMELSFTDINNTEIHTTTEINPYYRDTYTAIFKYILAPELQDGKAVRMQFFDILTHLLFETDRYQGMSHREYYIRFVIQELQNGICGDKVARQIKSFTIAEKIIVANGLLSLYRTGENMFVLQRVLKCVFTNSLLFANTREHNDLFFYLQTSFSEIKQNKIDCIITLFMPFRFRYEIYWEKIFGIQEIDIYMEQENLLEYEREMR